MLRFPVPQGKRRKSRGTLDETRKRAELRKTAPARNLADRKRRTDQQVTRKIQALIANVTADGMPRFRNELF